MAQSLGPFDYVIIGAGSAGCLLANRLSADPKVQVLLLEAGGKDDYFWIHVPVGYLYTIANPRTDWCYKTDADPGLNGRSIGYARGKVLGGCSSINAMIYMRGQKSDYDYWASLGNKGWSWDEVLPYFLRTEDYEHGASALHGAGGELRVEERRVNWEILDAWREAAAECGIPKIEEFNRGDNFGNAYFQMNQKRGVRWSNTKAFLRPVMHRPNLTVVTNAHVERIVLQNMGMLRRATGVEFRLGPRGKQIAEARREVILSAGAIGSPQILQLSGIGPAALLKEHGIEVEHNLPGVGENLHDHLQVRIIYKVKNVGTLNERANSLFGKAAMGLEYLLYRTGPLTMPPSQLGAFAKSDPSQAVSQHRMACAAAVAGQIRFAAAFVSCHHAFGLQPASHQPRPGAHQERRSLPASVHQAQLPVHAGRPQSRRGLHSHDAPDHEGEGAGKIPARKNSCPDSDIETEEQLSRAAGDLGTTIFHPVGTCRMGRDRMAVVDERLKVRDMAGLRVIDASVMPRITSGNTNAPTTMIAEKGAEMLLADWKA